MSWRSKKAASGLLRVFLLNEARKLSRLNGHQKQKDGSGEPLYIAARASAFA
jgi:hypothetical protein